MKTAHASTHGKPKQNNYFLRARNLKKEGVQITVPTSGNLKVIQALLYAKSADGKACAIWQDQSLPDCWHNATEEVDGGKTRKCLCLSLQVWEEMYKCTFHTKHNNLEAVKLALKEIISSGPSHLFANTEM